MNLDITLRNIPLPLLVHLELEEIPTKKKQKTVKILVENLITTAIQCPFFTHFCLSSDGQLRNICHSKITTTTISINRIRCALKTYIFFYIILSVGRCNYFTDNFSSYLCCTTLKTLKNRRCGQTKKPFKVYRFCLKCVHLCKLYCLLFTSNTHKHISQGSISYIRLGIWFLRGWL